MSTTPHIRTFVLGDYQTNCFVVTATVDAGRGDPCWIVDCGFEPTPMLDAIADAGLAPTALLLTHAHPDHIAGVDAARARFGELPVWLHEAERGWLADPMLNLSALLGVPVTCAEPDHWLTGGETLTLGETTWEVMHTPGHSPGGVVFLHRASAQAIVGDTLFAGSIGRIDFPSSNPDAMRRSLHEVLMSWPDDVTVHPGHGPATTIGRERATNPFLR
ncbi:MAG: MBL fold metallo-hydrolase [Phycisphaerales bacterium]|nr:MBL fold metallo-hydrolase [Phycisphaerales bacterium]